MADIHNHYERAFDAYLRIREWPLVPVNETRRTLSDATSLKSLDFIIAGGRGMLLIDVKGRKLGPRARPTNWATQDDLDSLLIWRARFGPTAHALLAFVYWLPSLARTADFTDHFALGETHYGCLCVEAQAYAAAMKQRSPKWKTRSVPTDEFVRIAKPLSHWLETPPAT